MSNYNIDKKNYYNEIASFLKIDNILPALSSSFSGLVVLQLFNMFNDLDFVDFINSIKAGKNIGEINEKEKEKTNNINIINDDNDNITSFYKNGSFNLANNIYLLYDILSYKK